MDAWLPRDKAAEMQMQMTRTVCELIKIRLFLLFLGVGGWVPPEKGLLPSSSASCLSFLVAIYWLCLPWHLLHGAASFNYAFPPPTPSIFPPELCLISGGVSGKTTQPPNHPPPLWPNHISPLSVHFSFFPPFVVVSLSSLPFDF